ncbi:hypothetical protein C8R47DRAFT_1205692 [Mycena vitilis]|nr:hypothetical protein C8R47DRAFT_1205692 [Mycena vitilis]
MSLSSDQANHLLQLASDARLTGYLAAASLTLVVLEWLLSLPREVDMVWIRCKSAVKWLYVWNRYFTFAMVFFCTYGTQFVSDAVTVAKKIQVYLQETPSDTVSTIAHVNIGLSRIFQSCFISQQVQGIGATVVIGTVDIILLLRWNLDFMREITQSSLCALANGHCEVEIAIMLCITILTVNNLTEFVHVG